MASDVLDIHCGICSPYTKELALESKPHITIEFIDQPAIPYYVQIATRTTKDYESIRATAVDNVSSYLTEKKQCGVARSKQLARDILEGRGIALNKLFMEDKEVRKKLREEREVYSHLKQHVCLYIIAPREGPVVFMGPDSHKDEEDILTVEEDSIRRRQEILTYRNILGLIDTKDLDKERERIIDVRSVEQLLKEAEKFFEEICRNAVNVWITFNGHGYEDGQLSFHGGPGLCIDKFISKIRARYCTLRDNSIKERNKELPQRLQIVFGQCHGNLFKDPAVKDGLYIHSAATNDDRVTNSEIICFTHPVVTTHLGLNGIAHQVNPLLPEIYNNMAISENTEALQKEAAIREAMEDETVDHSLECTNIEQLNISRHQFDMPSHDSASGSPMRTAGTVGDTAMQRMGAVGCASVSMLSAMAYSGVQSLGAVGGVAIETLGAVRGVAMERLGAVGGQSVSVIASAASLDDWDMVAQDVDDWTVISTTSNTDSTDSNSSHWSLLDIKHSDW